MFRIKIICGFKMIGIMSVVTLVVTSVLGFLMTPMIIGTKIKVVVQF